MGGVFSSTSDFVVNQFCTCFCMEVNNICRLDKNLKDLVKDMGRLKARRDDVLRRVETAEDAGQQRLSEVDVWLTEVENIENKAREMTTACAGRGSSFWEDCSRKLVSRFRYGEEVFSMLEDVKELTDQMKDFHEVAQPPRRDVVEERGLEPIIVGQETILESAWSRLRDDRTLRMGLYGMGGVGKTTLLDQINKFCVSNDGVDIVIWIVVSKNKRNEKIQDEIAKKLDFITGGESWTQKTKTEKAYDISNSLKKKRFVLLLDDIWSKVELTNIGVPSPTMENKCKIVFTTRSKEVCVLMGDKNPIEVSCLDTYKAWELFKEKVGETTLGSHPGIPELARKVAGKCQGLPLALNVLGETMSFRDTIEEWRHAVNKLTSSAAKFSGMNDKILPILKFSYDSLKEEHVKQCFLYCSLFPEDCKISKDMLIEYWICEGFIQEKQGRENAFNEGNAILSHLVRVCLLEESTNKKYVKMHDVVREMALWVASDLGKHKGRYTVHADVGLRELPEVENWGLVRKMSLMNNEIEELSDIPYCPQLTTLLLQENPYLVHISGEFFQSMPNVVVLDLSGNKSLVGLPKKISELVSLRYLDLSYTGIKKLHVGLQKLRKLIYLNLELTFFLESISGISKLWSLRTLRLRGTKISPDVSLLNELERLENLEVLTIQIKPSLVAHKFLSSHRLVQCTKELYFSGLHEPLTLPTMGSLSFIDISSCEMQEIKIVKTSAPWDKSPASPCFSSLCSVVISHCQGPKDLTWLLLAPNLTDLEVSSSDRLEDIISEEKALSSVTDGEAGIIIPFLKLETLHVRNLPMLKSIYWNTLRFPCLREIHIIECPNLRKLPLNSQSVDRVEELVIFYSEKEWIENVEWEDEATQLRFLPKCRFR